MENTPSGVIFVFIGIVVVLIGLFTLCGSKKIKTAEDLVEEKINSGSYTVTTIGTHEYRKDKNNKIYVRNDTTTIIE